MLWFFLFFVVTLSPSNQSFLNLRLESFFFIWYLVFGFYEKESRDRDSNIGWGLSYQRYPCRYGGNCRIYPLVYYLSGIRTNGNFLGCRIHTFFFSRFPKSQNQSTFFGGFTASHVSFPSVYLFTYFFIITTLRVPARWASMD